MPGSPPAPPDVGGKGRPPAADEEVHGKTQESEQGCIDHVAWNVTFVSLPRLRGRAGWGLGFGAILPGEGLDWIRRFPAITRIGGEPPGSGNGGLDGYLRPGSPPRVHRPSGHGK